MIEETNLGIQTVFRCEGKIQFMIQHLDPKNDDRGVELFCTYNEQTGELTNITSNLPFIGDKSAHQRLLELKIAYTGVRDGIEQVIDCDESSLSVKDPYFYGDECGFSFDFDELPLRKNKSLSIYENLI